MGGSLHELGFLRLRYANKDSSPLSGSRFDGQVPLKILGMGGHIREPNGIVPNLGRPEPNPVIPDFQPGGSLP
jgi:hypothetical protein